MTDKDMRVNAPPQPPQAVAPQGDAPPPVLSVVVPVYRGARLLDDTFSQILALENDIAAPLEIIAVDDGSPDDSFSVLCEWQAKFPNKIRVFRLRQNYGEMAALQAGIALARGRCVAKLPQDLQDTPEQVAAMFAAWKNGDNINLTFRVERDERWYKKIPANIYHRCFRLFSGLHSYPKGGFGTFVIDEQIAALIMRHPVRHGDVMTHIFSLGGARLHAGARLPPKGGSNWIFSKKIKLVIDNLIGFSYFPVRMMSLVGGIIALLSFCYALYALLGKLGWYEIDAPPGWATLVILLTMLQGLGMVMLGVIGEYLWRILDCVRAEPSYIVAEKRDAVARLETPPRG